MSGYRKAKTGLELTGYLIWAVIIFTVAIPAFQVWKAGEIAEELAREADANRLQELEQKYEELDTLQQDTVKAVRGLTIKVTE